MKCVPDIPQSTALDTLTLLFNPETKDILRLADAEDQADNSVRLVKLVANQRHQKAFVQERRDRVLQSQRELASAGLLSGRPYPRENNSLSHLLPDARSTHARQEHQDIRDGWKLVWRCQVRVQVQERLDLRHEPSSPWKVKQLEDVPSQRWRLAGSPSHTLPWLQGGGGHMIWTSYSR